MPLPGSRPVILCWCDGLQEPSSSPRLLPGNTHRSTFMSVTFSNTANIFDSADTAFGSPWGVNFAYVAGNPYLYVGGFGERGISAFSVSAAGQLTNVLGPDGNVRDSANANLAITQPAGLAVLSIGGNSFLYAAGLGESGMSAFTLAPNGAMFNLAGA